MEKAVFSPCFGSNSTGKTTTVNILSTLLKSDGGTASICGFDVAAKPDYVRQSISLTGQFAAVDEILKSSLIFAGIKTIVVNKNIR